MSNIAPRELQIMDGLKAKQQMVKSLLNGDIEKTNKFLATAAKVGTDQKLSSCSPQSIIDACINVAQLGLDLSPTIAHAYLVPFKGSIQLIVSARGYTALLARTGWKVKSYIVNDGDEFEYNIDGFTETVRFKKNLDNDGEFKYAVALAQSPDGELFVEVMNMSKIEKHRKASSNQGEKASGVWLQWFDEMATKTVIKKLVKRLPIGEEISSAMDLDDKTIETVEALPVDKKVSLNTLVQEQPKESKFDYFFSSRGIPENDKNEFIDANGLTDDDAIEKFLNDQSGAEALLDKFYEQKDQ